jgi:hypothetical protein
MSAMRRIFTLGVVWLAAAIVAAVVAWQGVGLIGDQVTDDPDGMLTAEEIDAALASGGGGIAIPPTTTTLPAGSDTTVAGATPPSTTAADAGAGGTTPGQSTTPSRGTAPATGSNGDSGSAGQAPAPAPAAVVRNYSVAGGTASISFSPSEVKVLLARPATGWTVKTEPEGGGVRVEFESGNARSRIDAWWDGGPQDRVEDSGGSGGPG